MKVDVWGVPPQTLQAVKASLLVHEHVNHDVDEVQENPVRDTAPLDVLRFEAPLVEQSFLDRVGDRQHLARGRPVADDEVVGELAEAPEIENEDVFGFLVGCRVDDLFQYGFQRGTSSIYNRCR